MRVKLKLNQIVFGILRNSNETDKITPFHNCYRHCFDRAEIKAMLLSCLCFERCLCLLTKYAVLVAAGFSAIGIVSCQSDSIPE